MNLLILSHRVPFPPNKGEKIRTYHQIEYLKAIGHQVQVICPLEGANDQLYCEQLSEKLDVTCTGIKIGNRKLKMLAGLIKGKALSVANFYDSSLQQKIDEYLARETVDTIICTASSMAEYIFNSSSVNTQTNLVMDFMDLDSDKWRQYAQRSAFPKSWVYQREQKLLAAYELKIAAKFNSCLFISDAEVELFCKNLADNSQVHAIANGIDTSLFKVNLERDYSSAPRLLFTGVMDYLPNVDAVVWFVESVWPQVIEKYPEAQFYIAGMNPNEKVKALDKKQGIVVTGFVEDIMPYYDLATLFIAPFRIARGVQNKVLQAMACGLPVVTTNSGGEGIDYTDSGNLIIANTEDEIFEKIQYCIENPAQSREIGLNAAELIQQGYSWTGKLKMLGKLIESNSKVNS